MPWTSVSLSDVLAHSRTPRITAAWDADDDQQRDAWFETHRANVVASIRAACGASGKYALEDDAAKIPLEFHDLACLRLLVKIMGRVGPTAGTGGQNGADPLALTGDQRDEKRRLEADLKLVAEGKQGLSLPATVEATPTVATAGNVAAELATTPSPRRFTRTQMDGL